MSWQPSIAKQRLTPCVEAVMPCAGQPVSETSDESNRKRWRS